MRKLSLGSVLLGLVALAPAVLAGGKADEIDALIGRYTELRRFNGAVLVTEGGDVVLKQGYGMANFEWNIPNTPDTRFRLGSVTKQFTATVVLQLVEEGKLSLDARLGDVLPWYRQETGARVTIHQLLNHTSGIPSYTGLPKFFREHSRIRLSLRALVETYCSGDLEFEPGEQFRYSNSGYVILGAVIEERAGKPYEQALQERVLDPVGMKASGYDRSEPLIVRRAAGYERDLSGLRNADYLDMSLPHAAGALYSTAEDLYLWDQAFYGEQVLSAGAKERMFTPGLGSYGYGWSIRQQAVGPQGAERTVIRHAGGINGFSSLIVRVPEERHLVVLLNNTGDAPLGAMASGVLDILYGREPERPRPSVAAALLDIISEKGLEVALARYRELKAEQATAYDFGEGELNTLGYALLGQGRTDHAIAVFTLNVEMFPEAFNTHDSLAEAYTAAGQKELAIKSYARSLELYPGNVNAVRKLQELVGQ